jgi:hypothetical protein
VVDEVSKKKKFPAGEPSVPDTAAQAAAEFSPVVIPVEDLAAPARGNVSGETRAGPAETLPELAASAQDQQVSGDRGRRSTSIAMVLPAHLLFASPAVDPQTPG